MKNNQHQILFQVSYKTCNFKDINFSVTLEPFLVKNDVISPSKNLDTPSKFDLYDLKMICAKFYVLVII